MRNAVTSLKNAFLLSVVAVLCLLGPLVSRAFATDQPDLTLSDWSVSAKPNLATHPPSREAVTALVRELDKNPHIFVPEPEDFRFADLRGSGTLSLLGTVGPGAHCHEGLVIVIDKTPFGFESYVGSGGSSTAADVLQDIDGTGKYELVTYQTLFFRDCASGGPIFPVIYAWTGAGYENVSDRFPDFYRRELRKLESNIEAAEAEQARRAAAQRKAAEPTPQPSPALLISRLDRGKAPQLTVIQPAQPTPTPPPAPLAAPKLITAYENAGKYYWRIEAAKIKRFLGISRDAGMGYAISLVNSDEWRDRVLAAQIFANIATPEAQGYLRTLSRDSEPPVAGTARNLLRSPKFEPYAPFRFVGFVPFKNSASRTEPK